MLKAFYDWPRQDIALYQENTTYSTSTGVVAVSYALREIKSVWIYSSTYVGGMMKRYFNDKVISENQYFIISESSFTKTDIVFYDSEFYKISVDNIMGMGEVYMILLQRIEKPVYSGELPVLNGGVVC